MRRFGHSKQARFDAAEASPEFIKPFGQNHQALIPVGRYSECHVLCANVVTSKCITPAHFVIPDYFVIPAKAGIPKLTTLPEYRYHVHGRG